MTPVSAPEIAALVKERLNHISESPVITHPYAKMRVNNKERIFFILMIINYFLKIILFKSLFFILKIIILSFSSALIYSESAGTSEPKNFRIFKNLSSAMHMELKL